MRKLVTLVTLFLMMGGVGLAFSQDREPPAEPPAEKPFLDFNFNLAAGWGSEFAEEKATLSADQMKAVVHADLLGIDLFDSTSGISAEFNLGGEQEYSIWSLNRAVIPGSNGRLYAGSDLKIVQNDQVKGAKGDFDLRLVAGTQLARIGSGALNIEFYMIEEDRPMAFSLVYDFQ